MVWLRGAESSQRTKNRHYEMLIRFSKQQIQKKPTKFTAAFYPFIVFISFHRSSFFNYRQQTLYFTKYHKRCTFLRTVSPVTVFSTVHSISHPLTATAAEERCSTLIWYAAANEQKSHLHWTALLGSMENSKCKVMVNIALYLFSCLQVQLLFICCGFIYLAVCLHHVNESLDSVESDC